MTEEKPAVKTEVVVAAAEPAASANQNRLGRPMLMLLILIGAAIAGIAITVAVLSK